jgi:hypothetical protein
MCRRPQNPYQPPNSSMALSGIILMAAYSLCVQR